MRQYKFRAWDKGKKCFIPTEVWAICQTDFKAFGVMLKDWEDYREGEYFYDYIQELSQFTGLKDKNGNEIYEGDILTSTLGNGLPSQIKFGEFHDDAERDFNKITFVGFYFHEQTGERTAFGKSIYGNTECFEVIGNIYENP